MVKILQVLLGLAATCFLVCPHLALAAEDSGKENAKYVASELNFSDLLFPKSAHWKSFESLEKPTLERQSLKIFIVALIDKAIDHCPIDDSRIAEAQPHFRKLTIPQTGEVALIYSGPALCREGDQTQVWRYYSDRGNAAPAQSIPWAHKILRIEIDRDPRFVGVSYGCCADPHGAFYRADLFNPDGVEVVRTSSFLEIPETATYRQRWRPLDESATDRGGFNLGGVLRFSPEINDEKNSDDVEAPKYGNIARHLPSFVAVQLLSYIDASGKKWAMVRTFDRGSDADGYGDVDVGWIQEPEYRDVP